MLTLRDLIYRWRLRDRNGETEARGWRLEEGDDGLFRVRAVEDGPHSADQEAVDSLLNRQDETAVLALILHGQPHTLSAVRPLPNMADAREGKLPPRDGTPLGTQAAA